MFYFLTVKEIKLEMTFNRNMSQCLCDVYNNALDYKNVLIVFNTFVCVNINMKTIMGKNTGLVQKWYLQ